MPTRSRLSQDERRAAIVEAVIPVFAKKGFHGTTIKELAGAAGISEALLYRHFSSKESLYEEIQAQSCVISDIDPLFDQFQRIPASTEKLVFMVYLIIYRIAIQQDLALPRLMANSLLEDGQFARLFLENFSTLWHEIFTASLRAAGRSGDMVDGEIQDSLKLWFCHHLAAALLFVKMPGRTSVEYGVSREDLVEQATRFCLRGLGLRDAAIAKHFDSKKLTSLTAA